MIEQKRIKKEELKKIRTGGKSEEQKEKLWLMLICFLKEEMMLSNL